MSDLLSDPLRELLRSDALGVAKDVRVMLQRDVRISMPHKPGDDVNWSACFEQLRTDGDNLIEETNSSRAAVARYEGTQNIDEPLAMLRSAATSYYHADGLGSITSLSNAAGQLAQTYTFDSFGKLTASSGFADQPIPIYRA